MVIMVVKIIKKKKENIFADFLNRYFRDAFSCHWACC